LDINTYKFSKSLYKRCNSSIADVVSKEELEKIESMVAWLTFKGFVLYHANYIKEIHYNEDPIPAVVIPGSFQIELTYDLGEDIRQFIKVSIFNNVHISDKTLWRASIDDGLPIPLGDGDDFNLLKKTINNVSYFNEKLDDMFEMLKAII
jgi:hypothetical protein